jgi:hypothetical protein
MYGNNLPKNSEILCHINTLLNQLDEVISEQSEKPDYIVSLLKEDKEVIKTLTLKRAAEDFIIETKMNKRLNAKMSESNRSLAASLCFAIALHMNKKYRKNIDTVIDRFSRTNGTNEYFDGTFVTY